MLIFLKEVKESNSEMQFQILIIQRCFDPTDKYSVSEENRGERVEKNATEFCINKIYGCQVVISNASINSFEVQVLTEVPNGSIPIRTLDYTKSQTIKLNSYSTQTIEYFFYFPTPGVYKMYASNVSKNGVVMAIAEEMEFKVELEILIKNLDNF